MKLALFLSAFCFAQVCLISANERSKRQASGYSFPGPRRQRQTSADDYYRKPQYESLTDRYDPDGRTTAAQTYSPSSQAAPQGYSGQGYSGGSSYDQPSPYQPQPRTRASSATYPKQASAGYGSNSLSAAAERAREEKEAKEEEENKKPDRLALLLQDSKFSCNEKKDGYYADDTVGCQIFHYCVSGAKHSWQCPEATVFHQVHLNCVPANQDICQQSSKYYVVNDYLYKELDQRGPNNSVRYSQRFYPEEFLREDPQLFPAVQHFGGGVDAPAPAARPSRPRSQSPSYSNNDGYDSDSYGGNYGGSDSYNGGSSAASYPSQPSYPRSYAQPAPAPAPAPAPRPQVVRIYKPRASSPSYAQPDYSTQAATAPTRRPTSSNYPANYGLSAGSSAASYPSAVPNYAQPQSQPNLASYGNSEASYPTSYPSSAAQPNYGAQSSAGYSSPSSSSYPSSSANAGYSPYKPQAVAPKPSSYPASYPSNYPSSQSVPVGTSFRVGASPAYGSSPQATRLRSTAYASPSAFSYPGGGAYLPNYKSGVEYDEEY